MKSNTYDNISIFIGEFTGIFIFLSFVYGKFILSKLTYVNIVLICCTFRFKIRRTRWNISVHLKKVKAHWNDILGFGRDLNIYFINIYLKHLNISNLVAGKTTIFLNIIRHSPIPPTDSIYEFILMLNSIRYHQQSEFMMLLS